MIDLLYPIFNLNERRKEIFLNSIKSIDRSNIRINVIDTGIKKSIDEKKVDNYLHVPIKGLYNKSKAINIGVRKLIKTDNFIVSDADIIFIDKQYNLSLNKKSFFLAKPFILVDFKTKWLIDHSYGVGKIFITNKKTFEIIKGFDENYVGYGYEDVDFAASYYILKKEPYSFIDSLVLHLDHSDINSSITNNKTEKINKDYFKNKFSKYDLFLNSIYDKIKERKNDS